MSAARSVRSKRLTAIGALTTAMAVAVCLLAGVFVSAESVSAEETIDPATQPVYVESIELTASGTLVSGGTITLTAVSSASDASATPDNPHVKFTITSGEDYASISSPSDTDTGGTCTIQANKVTQRQTVSVTATAEDSNQCSTTTSITIEPVTVSLSSPMGVSVESGGTITVMANVGPSGISNPHVTFGITSGGDYATISSSTDTDTGGYCVITAKSTSTQQTFTVTATSAYDTGVTASMTVSVTPISAELVYDANGGDGVPDTQTLPGAAPGEQVEFTISDKKPTRDGYRFIGWSVSNYATSASYQAEGKISVSAGSSKTLYAIWSPYVTLSYDLNDTSATGLPDSTTGSTATTTAPSYTVQITTDKPELQSYNFSGWALTDKPDSSTHIYAPGESITISEDTTLYAVWRNDTVTVTIDFNGSGYLTDANGNAFSGNEIIVSRNTAMTVDGNTVTFTAPAHGTVSADALNAYASLGYTFSKWDAASGTITDNTTLKAVFAANPYTVNVTYNGNGAVEGAPKSFTMHYGATYTVGASGIITFTDISGYDSTVTFTSKSNNGYRFAGWMIMSSSEYAGANGIVTSDETFTATFTQESYTLTVKYVDKDTGAQLAESEQKEYPYNEPYTVACKDIQGYIATQSTISGVMPANGTTETFEYKKASYTVTLKVDGGGTVEGAGTFEYNSTTSIVAKAQDGYTFSTWSDGDTNASRLITVTGDIELTAVFEPNTYTLTLHYQFRDGTQVRNSDVTKGGDGKVYVYTGTYAFNQSYSVKSPDIEGYVPDYLYYEGTMVVGGFEATITYRAENYTVTVNYLDYDDTSKAIQSSTSTVYHYDQTYTVDHPEITGYRFISGNVEGTMGDSNITYNLLYKIVEYELRIHYLYQNGTEASEDHVESVKFNTAYSVATPSISGYEPSLVSVDGYMPAGNFETTVWYKPIDYKITVYYRYSDEETSHVSTQLTKHIGDDFEIIPQPIVGYDVYPAKISDTVKTSDMDFTFIYTVKEYTLTIHYQYSDTKAIDGVEDYTEQVTYNTQYAHGSPGVKGYTPDKAVVEGIMDAKDTSITVVYTPKTLTLTINYRYSDVEPTVDVPFGADTYNKTYGQSYNETVPQTVTYNGVTYTADQKSVKGTMDSIDNKIVTVTYTPNVDPETTHVLTIYCFDGDEQIATVVYDNVPQGQFSYDAPSIDGYTVWGDDKIVSGTIINDTSKNVRYSPIKPVITVNYMMADETTVAHDPVVETLDFYSSYNYISPAIEGYTPSVFIVYGIATLDRSVTVTYTANTQTVYDLTIKYLSEDGSEITKAVSIDATAGRTYTIPGLSASGYTLKSTVADDGTTVISEDGTFTMPEHDLTVTLTYSVDKYTLTVKYTFSGGSRDGETFSETKEVVYGNAFSFETPTQTGYTASRSVVSGTADSDQTYEVTYFDNTITLYSLTVYSIRNGEEEPFSTMTASLPEGFAVKILLDKRTGYSITGVTSEQISSDRITLSDGLVTFDMLPVSVVLKVVYTAETHTVHVDYYMSDNTEPFNSTDVEVAYGDSYEIQSPSVKGYTPSDGFVRGTMGLEDVSISVTYAKLQFIVTINYRDDVTNEILQFDTYTIPFGETQSFVLRIPDGYTCDKESVTVTMADANQVVDVYCTALSYTVTFYMDDGEKVFHRVTLGRGDIITLPPEPSKVGYRFSGWVDADGNAFVAGTSIWKDTSYYATFVASAYHTLTLEYRIAGTQTLLDTDGLQLYAGDTYSISREGLTRDGCEFSYLVDGSAYVGAAELPYIVTMPDSDYAIVVYYSMKEYGITIDYVGEDGGKLFDSVSETARYMDLKSYRSPEVSRMAADAETVAFTMPAHDVHITVTYHPQSGVAFLGEDYAWSMTVDSTEDPVLDTKAMFDFLTASKETVAGEDGTETGIITIKGTVPQNPALVSSRPYTLSVAVGGTTYYWTVYVAERSALVSTFETDPHGMNVTVTSTTDEAMVSSCIWSADDATNDLTDQTGRTASVVFGAYGLYDITCRAVYFDRYVADPYTAQVDIRYAMPSIKTIEQTVGETSSVIIDVPVGTVMSSSDGHVTFEYTASTTTMVVKYDAAGQYDVVVTAQFADGTTDSATVRIVVSEPAKDDGGKDLVSSTTVSIMAVAGIALLLIGFLVSIPFMSYVGITALVVAAILYVADMFV